jgi:membrane associated rhomboid family serine protease
VGWDVWVVLAASALALQLFTIGLGRQWREQLPYAGMLLIDLGVLCLAHATHRDEGVIGVVATSLALVLIMGPRLADNLERRMLARDELSWALRAVQLHELLVPGRASTRRRRQLHNLVEARAGGAVPVLRRLRAELAVERDARAVALLHEEVATVCFMAQRFADGVAETERHLPREWAAAHPGFCAYLVRAYGELGRIDRALETLLMLEHGPALRDPNALALLTQSRLTLLAFAGRADDVERLLRSAPGLLVSPRAKKFLHEVAHSRAPLWTGLQSEPELRTADSEDGAAAEMRTAEPAKRTAAKSRSGESENIAAAEMRTRESENIAAAEMRTRESENIAAAELRNGGPENGGAAELRADEPESRRASTSTASADAKIRSHVAAILDGVAVRTAESTQSLARSRANRRPRVTLALLAINIAAAIAVTGLAAQPSASALIRAGALFRPAVQAGEWWRAFTAMFLHGDWVHLGLNMYVLYLLGRFAEDVLGPLRFFVIYVAGGLAGWVASTLALQQVGLSVGASGAIMGLLGAIIVLLIVRRGTWPEAWRRSLLWTMLVVGALQIYAGFQLPIMDNAAHMGGLVGGAVAALLIAPGGLVGRSFVARALVVALAAAALVGFGWSADEMARTSLAATFAKLPTKEVTVHGQTLRVPRYWEYDAAHDVASDPYLGVQLGGPPSSPGPPIDSDIVGILDRIAKSGRAP